MNKPLILVVDFWVTVKVHKRIRPLRARAGKAGTVVVEAGA